MSQRARTDVDNWLQAECELMQLPVRKIAEFDPPKTKQGNLTNRRW
jgi:hypothetical protein